MQDLKGYLMNCSDIIDSVYEYLSFRNITENEEINGLICSCFDELEKLNSFKYIHSKQLELFNFLNKEPYLSFLSGSSGYYFVATTLGTEIDRLIKRYSVSDMLRAIVLDSTANAYLEAKADEYEKTLGENLSYRFCPGYQGSSVSDLKYIFEVLKPEKIGIELLPSGMMVPQKSMCGIIAIGKNEEKKCGNCLMLHDCAYRKADKKCYK